MAQINEDRNDSLTKPCPACAQLQSDYAISSLTTLHFPASKPINWGGSRPSCPLGSYLFAIEKGGFGVRLPQVHLGDLCIWNGESYKLCEKRSDHMSQLPPGICEFIPTFTSDSTVAKIQAWLQQCNRRPEHSICRPSTTFMPSRVIDLTEVNKEGKVRLIDTTGMIEKYVALSHCWGTSKRFLLTTSTIAEARNGITLDSLPKTFRDAIHITLKLCQVFLWIDSICIIQDDENDWLIQSRQMRDIYKNSYLTIAASNAKDDDDGFLHPFAKGESLKVVVTRPNGDPYDDIYIQSAKVRAHYMTDHGECPLDTRGWTLQEKLLPHRAVRFGITGLEWACRYQHGAATGIWNDFWRLNTPLQWRVMVQQYTRRHLTYDKDKLPAISGLAEMFDKSTNNRYCAGLWWEGLGGDLLWKGFRPLQRLVKPRSRTGPSWSWASLDGPVDFILTQNNPATIIYESKFIDSDIKLKTSNPYGEVESGSITLEGPIRAWKCTVSEVPFNSQFRTCEVRFDIQEPSPEQEVYELLILRTRDLVTSGVSALRRNRSPLYWEPSNSRVGQSASNVSASTAPGPLVHCSFYGLLVVKVTSGSDIFARVGITSWTQKETDESSSFYNGAFDDFRRRIVLV